MENLLAHVTFSSVWNGFYAAIRKTCNLKLPLAAVVDLLQLKCALSCSFLWSDTQRHISVAVTMTRMAEAVAVDHKHPHLWVLMHFFCANSLRLQWIKTTESPGEGVDTVPVTSKGSHVVINSIRVRKSVKLSSWDTMYSVEEEKTHRSHIAYTATDQTRLISLHIWVTVLYSVWWKLKTKSVLIFPLWWWYYWGYTEHTIG